MVIEDEDAAVPARLSRVAVLTEIAAAAEAVTNVLRFMVVRASKTVVYASEDMLANVDVLNDPVKFLTHCLNHG